MQLYKVHYSTAPVADKLYIKLISSKDEVYRKYTMAAARRRSDQFLLRCCGTAVLPDHHRHTIRTPAFQDDAAGLRSVRQTDIVKAVASRSVLYAKCSRYP